MGKKRTDEEYRHLLANINALVAQGKTKRAALLEVGLAPSVYHYAKLRLEGKKKTKHFIELAPKDSGSSPVLEIKLGDLTFILKDINPASIKTIIDILEKE